MVTLIIIFMTLLCLKFVVYANEKAAFAISLSCGLAFTVATVAAGNHPDLTYVFIFASYFSILLPLFYHFQQTMSPIRASLGAVIGIVPLLFDGPLVIAYMALAE
jgi:hypothetical protein